MTGSSPACCSQQCLQHLQPIPGVAGHRGACRDAAGGDQRVGASEQVCAGALRFAHVALHQRHGRQRQPGLRVVGIALQDGLQYAPRFRELMPTLQDRGRDQQCVDRRGPFCEPGRDHRLRATEIAGVAGVAAVVDVGIGQRDRDPRVAGLRGHLAADRVEPAHARIAGRRQVLEHRLVAGRNIRLAGIAGGRLRDVSAQHADCHEGARLQHAFDDWMHP